MIRASSDVLEYNHSLMQPKIFHEFLHLFLHGYCTCMRVFAPEYGFLLHVIIGRLGGCIWRRDGRNECRGARRTLSCWAGWYWVTVAHLIAADHRWSVVNYNDIFYPGVNKETVGNQIFIRAPLGSIRPVRKLRKLTRKVANQLSILIRNWPKLICTPLHRC